MQLLNTLKQYRLDTKKKLGLFLFLIKSKSKMLIGFCMGRPSEANRSTASNQLTGKNRELIHQLKLNAYAAGSVGEWAGAFALWMLIHEHEPSVEHRILLLETARLTGCLPAVPWLSTVSAQDIIRVLRPKYADHLLGELAIERPLSLDELDDIKENYGELPRTILANFRVNSERTSKSILKLANISEIDVSNASIWSRIDSSKYFEIDPGMDVNIPKLEVISPSTFVQAEMCFKIRPGSVHTLKNVTAWIGSDLMFVDGEPVVDFYSWPGSETNTAISDSRILRLNGSVIRVANEQAKPVMQLSQAVWVGYPHTSTWGHWVRDIMCRLIYLSEVVDLSQVPVLVDAAVPNRFLEFASIFFPNIKFVSLRAGTQVLVNALHISPSRLFAIHNARWSLNGLTTRLNGEPQSFARLRARLLEAKVPLDETLMKLNKVYLSREHALNFRSLKGFERLDRMVKKAGYKAIDPGGLTNIQQLSLFLGHKSLLGMDGSQWFLASLADSGTNSLIIGHDLAVDSRGRSWAIEANTGRAPRWILGVRDLPMAGYGEKVYHQSFQLAPQDWEVLTSAIESL